MDKRSLGLSPPIRTNIWSHPLRVNDVVTVETNPGSVDILITKSTQSNHSGKVIHTYIGTITSNTGSEEHGPPGTAVNLEVTVTDPHVYTVRRFGETRDYIAESVTDDEIVRLTINYLQGCKGLKAAYAEIYSYLVNTHGIFGDPAAWSGNKKVVRAHKQQIQRAFKAPGLRSSGGWVQVVDERALAQIRELKNIRPERVVYVHMPSLVRGIRSILAAFSIFVVQDDE